MKTNVVVIASISLLMACATTQSVSPKDTANARVHYDVAIDFFGKGEMRSALRELLRAVKLDPTLSLAHNALGLIYHDLGHLEEAEEHYKEAIKLKPKFSEAHNNFGTLLIDKGRYDDAIVAFQTALGDILYATPSLAEGNLGWAYYKAGNIKASLKHLRNAVAMNPKFCRGYEWLARISLAIEESDQVVASGRRFKKFCLDDPDIKKTIAQSYIDQMEYYWALGYLKQGQHDEARDLFAACSKSESDKVSTDCRTSLEQIAH
jgi:type IV pilus biogenesis/stability protein PilW